MLRLVVLGLVVGPVLAGCAMGSEGGNSGSVETLWIDSRTADCVGVGPMTCLRVKRTAGGEWEMFYDSIRGFDYEPGYLYEVAVRVTERPNPPADASSLLYELVDVRSRAADPGVALVAHAWQLESLSGDGVVAAGNEATMEFALDSGTAGGFSGCNRYSGSYETSGSALSFGMMRSTMMACPEGDGAQQEGVFLALLADTRSFEIDTDRLRLLDEGGAVLMTLVPRPNAELAGIEWHATMINNGKQAVVSTVSGSVVTAVFAENSVAGSGGCNRYQASLTRDGDQIEIGGAAATRKMCAEDGVMEQESAFFAALSSAATYRIDRRSLELRTAEGALAIRFKAAGAAP